MNSALYFIRKHGQGCPGQSHRTQRGCAHRGADYERGGLSCRASKRSRAAACPPAGKIPVGLCEMEAWERTGRKRVSSRQGQEAPPNTGACMGPGAPRVFPGARWGGAGNHFQGERPSITQEQSKSSHKDVMTTRPEYIPHDGQFRANTAPSHPGTSLISQDGPRRRFSDVPKAQHSDLLKGSRRLGPVTTAFDAHTLTVRDKLFFHRTHMYAPAPLCGLWPCLGPHHRAPVSPA